MRGVNKVILIGNVGKDPELKYTPSNKAVCTFSIATTEAWTDASGQKQEKTEWHNIVVWSKLAELCGQYLKKGRSAYVEGRLTTRSWDDKDGVKKYKTEIVANNVQFLDSKGGSGGAGDSGSMPGGGFEPSNDSVSEPSPAMNDDLPF